MNKAAQAQIAALTCELRSTQTAIQTLIAAINDLAAQMKDQHTRRP